MGKISFLPACQTSLVFAMYGTYRFTKKDCCTMPALPPKLLGSTEDIIAEIVTKANQNLFHSPSHNTINKSDPLPFMHFGIHCCNEIHSMKLCPS